MDYKNNFKRQLNFTMFNEYNVLRAANTTSRFASSESVIPGVPSNEWGRINAVNGVRSAATVLVNYSKNNPTGTLRKPLIIVEGYHVSFVAPSLQSNYDVDYFINVQLPEANVPGWDFNGRLDDIAGYDLVFVDFANGAADIVLNAGAVQEVINRVNANKVLDNRFGNIRQQNVVMGLSMGGLCARYALANMTKNFTASPTETRLLITHDSPHKGANVPLGLQYMIRMLCGVQLFGYNVFDIYPDYNDAIGLLDAPATRQLLLYRAATTNTFENNTFQDATYRPMITFGSTGPQPTYRFVAKALGNECANPLFNPGKTFINLGAGVSAGIYARFLFFKVPILSYKLAVAVESYALPATGSTNKIARVYSENTLKLFGFINIFKQLYNNAAFAPGTHLAVDGVPGSNYPFLNVDALNQLANLPIFKVNLYVSFPLSPFLGGYFGVYAYNAGVSYNFTFVSTASALDATPYNTPVFSQRYVKGVNQNYPSTSETFIAQETVQNNAALTNNTHIRFTARNSRWLFNEMENLNNSENCSGECTNPYFISGLGTICNNAVYSIPGLQRGATLQWVISNETNAGLVSFQTPNPNANPNNITINKNGSVNGTFTLTANITGGCAGQPTSFSKTIRAGISFTDINVRYSRNAGTVQNIDFGGSNNKGVYTQVGSFAVTASTNLSGTKSFDWIVTAASGYGWSNFTKSSPNCSFTLTGTNAPTIPLQVTLTNTQNGCSSSNVKYVVFIGKVPGGRMGNITVSPNPANENISVAFEESADADDVPILEAKAATTVRSLPSKVKTIVSLFEVNSSTLIRQWIKNEVNGKLYNFNIAGLRKGLYVLQVDRDDETKTTKIIIE